MMTEQEKAAMLTEIMGVVDKHIERSEKVSNEGNNTSDIDRHTINKKKMDEWKEEYKRIRVEGSKILKEVRNNPIDVSTLESSFDVTSAYNEI